MAAELSVPVTGARRQRTTGVGRVAVDTAVRTTDIQALLTALRSNNGKSPTIRGDERTIDNCDAIQRQAAACEVLERWIAIQGYGQFTVFKENVADKMIPL